MFVTTLKFDAVAGLPVAAAVDGVGGIGTTSEAIGTATTKSRAETFLAIKHCIRALLNVSLKKGTLGLA